jgi:hypothetical protein
MDYKSVMSDNVVRPDRYHFDFKLCGRFPLSFTNLLLINTRLGFPCF